MEATAGPLGRVGAIDAYRGLVMLLLWAEVLRTCAVAAALPASVVWAAMCLQQTHAAWVGLHLHDLIQPSFYFLVGASCWLSLRQPRGDLVRRTAVRMLSLLALGILVRSIDSLQVDPTETLVQIALAYPFVVLIARQPRRVWFWSSAGILLGYWLLFALAPLPPADFDYPRVHVSPDWLQAHGLSGFAAHWQKNSNIAWRIDQWFVPWLPGHAGHTGFKDGLATLNFVPSIATMLLGLAAADQLARERPPMAKARTLALAGASLALLGWALGAAGLCPVVKAIWTPSWVLFSGGICLVVLAAFYAAVDGLGFEKASWPLRVIGMNAIVAYAIYWLYQGMAFNAIRRVVGSRVFEVFGPALEPAVYGLAVMMLYWLVLYLLYRRRVFARL